MYIKYTKAEHLAEAVDRGRVHIGTFHYYQKAYRETWGDSDEGPVGFILRNDTDELWTLSWEDYVTATQDFNVARQWVLTHAQVSEAGYELGDIPPQRVIPPGVTDIQILRRGIDTFVFSVTEADAPSWSQMSVFEGYDTAYEISDIRAFGKHVAHAIYKALSEINDFGPRHKIRLLMKRVEYVGQKRIVVTPSTTHLLTNQTRADMDAYFMKPERFMDESEFRLVWLLIDEERDNAANLKIDPLFVWSRLIRALIRPIEPFEFVK